ncbi:MAG: hypothetical protein J6A07_06730 [Firmicutes bacterium]|nr:hypothetical protein [Bacillota bacterium]
MFEKNLVIVYTEKTKKHANYLMQLISNIKNEPIVAALWTEKDYTSNKAKISSSQFLIFIGDSKEMRAVGEHLTNHYEKYGMAYSWLGKTARLYADPTKIDKNNASDFVSYANEIKETFKEKPLQTGAAAGLAVAAALTPFCLLPGFGQAILTIFAAEALISAKEREKILDTQYSALVLDFFNDGLCKFMDIKDE